MISLRLFIDALWSPAGKGLISWLSFVMSSCEAVTFPLVSWVRFGTWLYRFLIFALFLTFITKIHVERVLNDQYTTEYEILYICIVVKQRAL